VQRSNKGGKQRPEHDREPVKYLRHDSATGKREFAGAIAAATTKSPWERAGESVEAGEEEEEQMKRSEMGNGQAFPILDSTDKGALQIRERNGTVATRHTMSIQRTENLCASKQRNKRVSYSIPLFKCTNSLIL